MCGCTGGLAAYACHYARSSHCVCACRGNCHGSRTAPAAGGGGNGGRGTARARTAYALAGIFRTLLLEGIVSISRTPPSIRARHRRIRLGARKDLRWIMVALGLSRTPEGGWEVQLPLDRQEDSVLREVAALLAWLEAENPGAPVRDIEGEAARQILEILEAAGWEDGP
jgi:hypothetical protein